MQFKTTYRTQLSDTSLSDLEGVGTLRFQAGKLYKWVKYEEGTAALDVVAGDVVGYTLNDYGSSFVTADITDMDTIPVMAGVMVAAVTVTNTYCWIQIGGACTLATTADGTTPTAGDVITMSASDKNAAIDPDANEVRTGFMTNTTTGVCLQCPW